MTMSSEVPGCIRKSRLTVLSLFIWRVSGSAIVVAVVVLVSSTLPNSLLKHGLYLFIPTKLWKGVVSVAVDFSRNFEYNNFYSFWRSHANKTTAIYRLPFPENMSSQTVFCVFNASEVLLYWAELLMNPFLWTICIFWFKAQASPLHNTFWNVKVSLGSSEFLGFVFLVFPTLQDDVTNEKQCWIYTKD